MGGPAVPVDPDSHAGGWLLRKDVERFGQVEAGCQGAASGPASETLSSVVTVGLTPTPVPWAVLVATIAVARFCRQELVPSPLRRTELVNEPLVAITLVLHLLWETLVRCR